MGEPTTKKKLVLGGLLAVAALGAAGVYRRYRQDLRAARERVATGRRVVETDLGPLEYGLAGQGPPVLVIHGAEGWCCWRPISPAPIASGVFSALGRSTHR
jgi:hypothetical protein